MEVKTTKDGSVYKFIHSDFSETAIKDVGGCSGLGSEASEKYSVFASCSYGCKMNCKFCMLSTKGCKYQRIEPWTIEENLSHAISYATTYRRAITKKKVKLAWMGMGEPLAEIGSLCCVTSSILRSVLKDHQKATGLDCVDVGTSFPDYDFKNMPEYLLDMLVKEVQTIPEVQNEQDRTRPLVRLFISLGSLNEETRCFLMGKHGSRFQERLDRLRGSWKVPNSLICHLLLFEGINDSPEEIEQLMRFFTERPDLELRLLRYNQCSGSPFTESQRFDEVSELFLKELPRVKVQTSPGSEVMAACGQFLV